jgi:NitT/TauT family transport system permease protein
MSGATGIRSVRRWQFGLVVAFLALWEGSTRAGWVDPFHVSMPSRIARQIGAWVAGGIIFRHMWVTLVEMALGFLAGTGLGVALGFLFAFLPRVARVFDPLMVLLNALPRVVLAPLFVLWFGLGLLSKVVMAVSLVFFVVFFATYSGIREVDRDLINNARILGASQRALTRHVLLPSALTWIFSSLRTSVGFALIGAVVGEYLGAHEGMGWLIYSEESMFRSTGVIAGLTILMLLVALIDFGMRSLEARFSHWKPRTA